ncbi:hypothetical protein UA08_08123 [Talaromyces atroroseus]|uniref:Cupin type-2 domain-containing protein n=1 Tax=Talaromyces atroroseus TaxID=1441469 RepID=A0A225A990_TALAT|nr:hypothetical protein UA08_08123 [Talaromyces atroroseus]OKL56580.1 hypothetical protein UA08_08123 [Talaromyces atroroseus]
MALVKRSIPPDGREPYIIGQLEGERITIPGSKGAFRILASAKQTGGTMAVFQSAAVLSDAPGFHYHNQAHDVFLVTKGYLKLWNGEKCRIMAPGDFAYVPPHVVHNPELLGPHTETYGLVTPGDWVDFFRHVSEPYEGVILPESDNRDLKALLIPKVMAAKGQFDVVFQPSYVPPALGNWDKDDEQLPESETPLPYYLRANTGPRWLLGGVLSRPFITTAQCDGVCAISSIESSDTFTESLLSRKLTFRTVDHCLCVIEGLLVIRIPGSPDSVIREGETALIPAGQAFSLRFGSRYVRVWSFTSGNGIESLVHRLGVPFGGFVLPDQALSVELDEQRVKEAAEELGVDIQD